MKMKFLYLKKKTTACLGILGLAGTFFYTSWIDRSHFHEINQAQESTEQNYIATSNQESQDFVEKESNNTRYTSYDNDSIGEKKDPITYTGQYVEYDYSSAPGYYIGSNEPFLPKASRISESFTNDITGESDDCCALLKTVRIEAGAAFGDFIGLHENYAEAGLFIAPNAICEKWQPFFDLRDYHFRNGCWGASAGVGLRTWNECCDRLYGVNLYYDHREILFKQNRGCDCICDIDSVGFNSLGRVGVGLEYLGGWLDYRANGYFPVTNTRHKGHTVEFNNFTDGYRASLQPSRFFRYGADVEAGRQLWQGCDATLYAALGGYYYSNKQLKDLWGPQARVEVKWKQYLSLEFRYSYDCTYHSRFQGKVLLSIPLENLFFCKSACQQCWDDFILQPVKRFGIPFADKGCCWKWNW